MKNPIKAYKEYKEKRARNNVKALVVVYEPYKFQVGDLLKDVITGFIGVVENKTQWINNCNSYALRPNTLHKGKLKECESFDEVCLELVSDDKAFDHPVPSPYLFELGDHVESILEGFTGVVFARCTWINGCNNYSVKLIDTPELIKITDGQWFAESMLNLVHKNPYFAEQQERDKDHDGEKKTSYPRNTGGPLEKVLRTNR